MLPIQSIHNTQQVAVWLTILGVQQAELAVYCAVLLSIAKDVIRPVHVLYAIKSIALCPALDLQAAVKQPKSSLGVLHHQPVYPVQPI